MVIARNFPKGDQVEKKERKDIPLNYLSTNSYFVNFFSFLYLHKYIEYQLF